MTKDELKDIIKECLCESGIINEGFLKENSAKSKIDRWINEAKSALNSDDDNLYSKYINQYHSILKKYESTQYLKSHKAEMEKIYNALHEKYRNKVKAKIKNEILAFKKKWDEYKTTDTFEGRFLENCIKYGISANDIVNHYRKSKSFKQYKDIVILYYGSMSDAEEFPESYYIAKGCKLDDKCVIFYDNDDNIEFYDYTANKYINMMMYEASPASFSSTYSREKDFIDDDTLEEYKEAISELKIRFTV